MLGKRIALLRRSAGITQAMLADRLNISASAVGMYEQNRRQPPLDILIALSEEFGVTVDYLLTGRWNTRQDFLTFSESLLLGSYFRKSEKYCPGQEAVSDEVLAVLIAAMLRK